VERLSGVDANLLYMETPTVHMHTLKIAVLEPSGEAPRSLAAVKQELRDRLPLLPPFRRRLVELPFGFHHPVWITVEPDLDEHVRAATLPAPGGHRQLDELVARIASSPLDRSRPLWELWIVDGLERGRTAAVAKIHHSLADGIAVAELLANVMSPFPGSPPPAPREPVGEAEPVPSRRRLVGDAWIDHRRQLGRLPALVWRTARSLRAVDRRRHELAPAPPLPLWDTPHTILNGALSARRAFASTSLPLAEVRAVKTRCGVTLNDVVLALVAGAVRSFLLARGALPQKPLVAEVPAGTDRPGTRRLSGNVLSNIFTSLCTDVDDPGERLRAIHAGAVGAKEIHAVLGPDLYAAWSDYAPTRAFAGLVRLGSRLRLADRFRPPVNLIVSCVPGPRQPLYWAGGRLVDVFSVGPIIEGAALNVTAWSYVDHLNVGVLTCPDLIAEPHEIADGLHAALRELEPAEAAPSSGLLSPRRDDETSALPSR
jgi:diacylglycerol O-acyltransferase